MKHSFSIVALLTTLMLTSSVSAQSQVVPLNKDGTVLLDVKGKRVLVKSKVVLREGVLEMLACLKQTKEHESILAVDAKAYVIHTGLLALGVQPGKPVSFDPKFTPPQGTQINIFLRWTDNKGKVHRVPAQNWIRQVTRRFYAVSMKKLPDGVELPKDGDLYFDSMNEELSWFGIMTDVQRDALLKLSEDAEFQKAIKEFHKRSQIHPMTAVWVFGGSSFGVDNDGKQFYRAEGGDLICVANFADAMLDITTKSSASGEANLLWEAWTERIPPRGTQVMIELIPELPQKNTPEPKSTSEQPPERKPNPSE